LRVLEQLIERQPAKRRWRIERGRLLFDIGRADEAVPVLESCRTGPDPEPEIELSLGHAASAAGDMAKAVSCYRALLDGADPALRNVAWWSLADLKGYRFTEADVNEMRRQQAATTGPDTQRHLLLFALGRALEQAGEYDAAFVAWESANRDVARQRPWPEPAWRRLAATLDAIRDIPRRRARVDGPQPVFIVGMPRSGSTLVEQILASHSRVSATSELPFIENLARSLDARGGFANLLPQLSAGDCDRVARTYLEQVEPYLRKRRDLFTDKWPDNFWWIGLIRAGFPNAPVINVIRDPLDNALGVFKQYFARGVEHSSRFDWIAGYWEIYLDVLQHWESVLPGQLLHLRYADLVDEPDATARRMLEYCGLEYESDVLAFHAADRAVMTPSGHQVRQPIHRGALDSSRPYREHLAPCIERFEKLRERLAALPR
jgi:tetratricopeptide (TPR) repeat protein